MHRGMLHLRILGVRRATQSSVEDPMDDQKVAHPHRETGITDPQYLGPVYSMLRIKVEERAITGHQVKAAQDQLEVRESSLVLDH